MPLNEKRWRVANERMRTNERMWMDKCEQINGRRENCTHNNNKEMKSKIRTKTKCTRDWKRRVINVLYLWFHFHRTANIQMASIHYTVHRDEQVNETRSEKMKEEEEEKKAYRPKEGGEKWRRNMATNEYLCLITRRYTPHTNSSSRFSLLFSILVNESNYSVWFARARCTAKSIGYIPAWRRITVDSFTTSLCNWLLAAQNGRDDLCMKWNTKCVVVPQHHFDIDRRRFIYILFFTCSSM